MMIFLSNILWAMAVIRCHAGATQARIFICIICSRQKHRSNNGAASKRAYLNYEDL